MNNNTKEQVDNGSVPLPPEVEGSSMYAEKKKNSTATSYSFDQAIKAYLDSRANEDPLFAPKYANPSKNIKECCNYILGVARKRGNAVCMSANEVYGLAVHYYDEENIKVEKLPANSKVTVSSPASKPVKLTEEDKKAAREAAIKKLTEEQYASLKKKPKKAKKEDTEVQQMSLF